MGMRLSDPQPPRRFPCWGATILESLRGTHLAEVGDRYCKRCRELVDRRGVAAASMQVPGATDRGSSAATPVPSSGDAL